MNYDSTTTPNVGNFQKTTGRLYFLPDNDTASGEIDLGNVVSYQVKHGSGNAEIARARRGMIQRADDQITEVKPELDITLSEVRIRSLVPILVFGSRLADLVQAAASAATLTIPAVNVLRSYPIGATQLTGVAVRSGATTYTPDVDYQLDPNSGYLTIMEGGAITDSTPTTPSPVTVTYSCPALTRRQFSPYTQLNRYGRLRLIEEDVISAVPVGEHVMRVNLMPSDMGANDGKKYREDKLKAAILGAYQFIARA